MFDKFFMFTSISVIASAQIGQPNGWNIWTSINDIFHLNDISPNFSDLIDEMFLSVPDLIRREGYPVEEHFVETEDGYLLAIHRIPGSPFASNARKTTVLVLNAFETSSADWVLAGREKSLGFVLADHDFDVWLGNMRGNVYSRNHTTLSPCDLKFWDFSWHENGIYDIPAMVDYITKYKKEDSLVVVGYSMSNTAFYVTASEHPEIATKVRAMFNLGPLAYLDNVGGSLVLAFQFGDFIKWFIDVFFHGELLNFRPLTRLVLVLLCDINMLTEQICYDLIYSISGYDREQFNYTLIPKILGHFPAGASVNCFYHYSQVFKSGKFRQYDYGLAKNLIVYKNTTPPDYDLSKIKVPMPFIYGENDMFADPVDTERLYLQLPIKLEKYRVQYPKFSHLDFMWGINATDLVYKKLISMMKDYLS